MSVPFLNDKSHILKESHCSTSSKKYTEEDDIRLHNVTSTTRNN